MEIIKTVTEKDFGRMETSEKWSEYRVRLGARAVLFDEMSRVVLMYVSKQRYYKLPGGGVDPGEDIETALRREILEEVGITNIEVISELGIVCEYRDQWEMKAEHYGFIARNIGEITTPLLTNEEMANGYEAIWVDSVDKAIELVKSGKQLIDEYGQNFEIERELAFLAKAKDYYSQKKNSK